MAKLLLRIWQWLKSRFQNEVQSENDIPLTRAERRKELRKLQKHYKVYKTSKYGGQRRYTPAPAIQIYM